MRQGAVECKATQCRSIVWSSVEESLLRGAELAISAWFVVMTFAERLRQRQLKKNASAGPHPRKRPSSKASGDSDLFVDQSNAQNYESACPWGIYSHLVADEMVEWRTKWLSKT
jgi:hypothetical protein